MENLLSKIYIPYRTWIYVCMFTGLALLLISFHILTSITWLPYVAVFMMALAFCYFFYYLYKAGYRTRALIGFAFILMLCVTSIWAINKIMPILAKL